MHNSSFITPLPLLPPFSPSKPCLPFLLPPSHGEMLNLHVLPNLSLFLLFFHLFSFLLARLFSFLLRRATAERDARQEANFVAAADLYDSRDLIADAILGGDAVLFLYGGRVEKENTLLLDEVRDSKDQILLEEDDTFLQESEYATPLDLPLANPSPSDCIKTHDVDTNILEEKTHDRGDEKQLITAGKIPDFESEKLAYKIDQEVQLEREIHGGSLTGDSTTSKSSVEWRSSAIFRDSETEYPFSSSSRRSSSNWESYAMFRKYDEEMMFFDRISAQKLTETESFRSLNAKPRSISQRFLKKLMTKPSSHSIRMRNPYQELEKAYISQVCLAWEALNWNYISFLRAKTNGGAANSVGCPARTAQRFQQFLVLLQRFIENEPYEYGRRPEVFARMRLSSPKLLQVPEFREDDDEEEDSKISGAEFLGILEDAIHTFMNFLKADRKTPCEKLGALIRRKKKGAAVDHSYLRLLKKINDKKKLRLKELGRRRKCLKKRKKLREEGEMEILMAMIDMKVVSRVLRVEEMTEEQLQWCEEKMSKVRIWEGKMQRDSSPLFFPVH
ncbi:hypothetical protein AXF42_Ash018129 [Apostasia shenzhenica]|uniref:Uncharacterized protein n=1 Tax=Apostasia shenzhenica TaxID=1088818 RepID=A0A2I0AEY9_9ASPA|nr:hypothetical protein AXF42_Ash018129 [Apostasia shenzhenica]